MKKRIRSGFLVIVCLAFLLNGCALGSTPGLSAEELDKQLNDTYGAIVRIQVNGEFLNLTLQKISSGELVGLAQMEKFSIMSRLVDETDKQIAEVTPPDLLKPYWEDALSMHHRIKDILALVTQTYTFDLSKMEPILQGMNQITADLEATMVREYGFNAQELSAYRQGELDTMRRSFDAP